MRWTYAFSTPKCTELMLFRVPNAPDLWFFGSQMRQTYAMSIPKCAGLMLFRVPNAPDLCFFESQMRRTCAFSSPKFAGLMLFSSPKRAGFIFFDPQSARLMIFDCLDWLGSRWDNFWLILGMWARNPVSKVPQSNLLGWSEQGHFQHVYSPTRLAFGFLTFLQLG